MSLALTTAAAPTDPANDSMMKGCFMTRQQKLHAEATNAIRRLESAIDGLKSAGPCPLNGNNALRNLEERLRAILDNQFGR